MKRVPLFWKVFVLVQLVGILAITSTAYTASPVLILSFAMLFPGSIVMQAAHPYCYAHLGVRSTFVIEMAILLLTNAAVWLIAFCLIRAIRRYTAMDLTKR